jgi:hypothetical protein
VSTKSVLRCSVQQHITEWFIDEDISPIINGVLNKINSSHHHEVIKGKQQTLRQRSKSDLHFFSALSKEEIADHCVILHKIEISRSGIHSHRDRKHPNNWMMRRVLLSDASCDPLDTLPVREGLLKWIRSNNPSLMKLTKRRRGFKEQQSNQIIYGCLIKTYVLASNQITSSIPFVSHWRVELWLVNLQCIICTMHL